MAHGSSGHGGHGGALKEFFVALGLDADAASFASAQSVVDALEKGLEKLVEVAKEIPEKFAEMILSTGEYAHAVERVTEITGQASETVQELAYVSKLAGVASDSLTNGFVHLARSMAAARDGSKEAVEAYARLGVRVVNANGKLRDQEQVFDDVADAIAKLPPGAERESIALAVLGKSGAELLPVLGKGAEAIRKMREEAAELGLVMSPEAIERGAEFTKSLDKLRAVGQSLVHDFAEPIIEALNPLLESFTEWVKVNREVIRTNIQEFARGLVRLVERTGHAIGVVVDFTERLLKVLRVLAVFAIVPLLVLLTQFVFELIAAAGVTAAWAGEALLTAAALAFMGAEAVAAAAAAAAAWLAANAPLVLMTVLVAGLILGFQDLFVFLRGGRSVIGRVLNGYADEIGAFWEVLKAMVLPWWFQALFGSNAIDRVALGIGDWARGETPKTSDFVGGGAASPSAAASLGNPWETNWGGGGGGGSTIHAPVSILIQTTPNQSNDAVGDAAGKAAAEQMAKTLREAKSARR